VLSGRNASVLKHLMLCVACAACTEPGARSTLVRFEPSRPLATWTSSASPDASADLDDAGASDAAQRDAAPRGDDADAGPGDAGSESADKPISVCTFQVTTKQIGGRYAPKNIGAIWIEDSDDNWVKTLRLWAGVRQRYLSAYLKANTERNTLDAMTSATMRQHGTQMASWDLSDGAGKPVPDGEYKLVLEMTDRDNTGVVLTVPFTKSGEPLGITPEDTDVFTEMTLRCS
jgi:hypothetical protein